MSVHFVQNRQVSAESLNNFTLVAGWSVTNRELFDVKLIVFLVLTRNFQPAKIVFISYQLIL